VFSWKIKDERNLLPYFRVVHFLQLVAVGAMVTGLFLVWWKDGDSLSGFRLLDKSITRLLNRDVAGMGHPLLILWLLWPVVIVTGLRAAIGLMVPPVSFGWLGLVMWVLAALALVHFYVTFGDDLPDYSPLDDGSIRVGYCLTVMAVGLLGALLLIETRIRQPEDPWASQGVVRGGPVDDARRLWEGAYQTCPHCGMLNEPGARTCFNCQNLLFDLKRQP